MRIDLEKIQIAYVKGQENWADYIQIKICSSRGSITVKKPQAYIICEWQHQSISDNLQS